MNETLETGKKYSNSFKVYSKCDQKIVSLWHSIFPFNENGSINVFNEIPRFENAKFELSKNEPLNPIMQDVKNGKMRFVDNIFPFKGYPWNYGAVPQTWEDPNEVDKWCNAKGDNDPVDVIEIGRKSKRIGEVYAAKVLGALAMIDDGECDWKIVVIDVNDEKASLLHEIDDVEKVFPGLLDMTREWFKNYKIPDNKGENKFAADGKYFNKSEAIEILNLAHKSYAKLKSRDNSGINMSLCVDATKFDVKEKKIEEPTEIPSHLGGFYFKK
ncbi:Inorganic pyrophosphatase [Gurleya vavrai]